MPENPGGAWDCELKLANRDAIDPHRITVVAPINDG